MYQVDSDRFYMIMFDYVLMNIHNKQRKSIFLTKIIK